MDTPNGLTSLQLWVAGKYIARECATVNKDFALCKQAHEKNPVPCLMAGGYVAACSHLVVNKLITKYPEEFKSFAKCLNYNDYRYGDCRAEETALRNCWNADQAKDE